MPEMTDGAAVSWHQTFPDVSGVEKILSIYFYRTVHQPLHNRLVSNLIVSENVRAVNWAVSKAKFSCHRNFLIC